jgi:DNA-binding response OmpR family regulator
MTRVLIVDDEEFTLEVFQLFLELSGYQVITTINSEQAVRLVEREHPDCILLDVMMPGLDGFSLCQLIRSTPQVSQVPIIFCTAYAALDVEDRRVAVGGDLVIMKPFEMTALTQAIETVLLRRQQQAANTAVTSISQDTSAPLPKPRYAIKQTTLLGNMKVSVDPGATTETYMAALQHLITGE